MQRSVRILLVASLAACGRGGFNIVPDAAPDVPPPPPDAAPCGPGYDLQPEGQLSRYRIGAGMARWDDAEAACEADGAGAHLVVFDNTPEMNANEDIATAFGSVAFWIGISDRVTDMSFIPVTGGIPPFMPSWAANAPSLAGPSCLLFDPLARTLQDTVCPTLAYYICECDGVPVQDGAY